jgi:uncharacterized OB-fold protein
MNEGENAPPRRYSAQARRLGTQGAADELWLPVCQICGRVDYPLRELCANCLSERLEWQPINPCGGVLATTTLHRSNLPYFRPRLPLRVGSVKLDAGPVMLAFVDDTKVHAGARVRLQTRMDDEGAAVLVAAPAFGSA